MEIHDNITAGVERAIRGYIGLFGMFGGNGGILAGFSGGADSTALLHFLDGYCRESGRKLAALHVNHMIRGEEADRDERHCADFCRERGITLLIRRVDIPARVKKSGRGLEEEAREARYSAFAEAAAENGCEWIATAHNADDNLETMLFNLARGASASGIAGIPPVRGNIARPLLACAKNEIIAYCAENGLAYVTDSTNTDTMYTRNYIRSEIIPRLCEVNPAVRRSALRLCEELRADEKYLRSVSEGYSLADGRKALSALPEPILYRLLEREFRAFTNGLSLERVQLEAAARLIGADKTRFSLSLPGKTCLYGDRDTLCLRGDVRISREERTLMLPLEPGVNLYDGGAVIFCPPEERGELSKYINRLKNIYKFFIQGTVCSDKISGVPFIRYAGKNLGLNYGGMTRSCGKLLSAKKLSGAERAGYIAVCDEDGALWLPGFPPRGAKSVNEAGDTVFCWLH